MSILVVVTDSVEPSPLRSWSLKSNLNSGWAYGRDNCYGPITSEAGTDNIGIRGPTIIENINSREPTLFDNQPALADNRPITSLSAQIN
jgi:hypothetical protein